jgi:hypothetical protein
MFDIMMSLKEGTRNIERVFVDNYNKAKIMADLQFWMVGTFGLVFIFFGTTWCPRNT